MIILVKSAGAQGSKGEGLKVKSCLNIKIIILLNNQWYEA